MRLPLTSMASFASLLKNIPQLKASLFVSIVYGKSTCRLLCHLQAPWGLFVSLTRRQNDRYDPHQEQISLQSREGERDIGEHYSWYGFDVFSYSQGV